MRISIDAQHNVAYIHLQDRPATVDTVELSEDLFLDVGPDGTIYGLELLNANEQLRTADLAELEIENAESGETTRIKLPFPKGGLAA
ncbi:MAG TPA: DUF2283 domain-containing protein [Rhodothermales bacterium]|nr:DUF2283 domain-containing protein [Rhodothermales bacterium]